MNEHKCDYCNKAFKHESSLLKHMCVKKRRASERNQPHVLLALELFDAWYNRAMGSKRKKTWDDFNNSRYYNDFIRLSTWVQANNLIDHRRLIDWIVKNEVPAYKWGKESTLAEWHKYIQSNETAERALEKCVLYMEEWAADKDLEWKDYWAYATDPRLIHDIKMGKISPWIFLTVAQVRERVEALPPEMLGEIANAIDLEYWARRIDAHKPTVIWIRELLE